MDIGYEKERFVSFKIKASVTKKFRKFSKGISKSQSMTLLLMLEFFERNEIAPTEYRGWFEPTACPDAYREGGAKSLTEMSGFLVFIRSPGS